MGKHGVECVWKLTKFDGLEFEIRFLKDGRPPSSPLGDKGFI